MPWMAVYGSIATAGKGDVSHTWYRPIALSFWSTVPRLESRLSASSSSRSRILARVFGATLGIGISPVPTYPNNADFQVIPTVFAVSTCSNAMTSRRSVVSSVSSRC